MFLPLKNLNQVQEVKRSYLPNRNKIWQPPKMRPEFNQQLEVRIQVINQAVKRMSVPVVVKRQEMLFEPR